MGLVEGKKALEMEQVASITKKVVSVMSADGGEVNQRPIEQYVIDERAEGSEDNADSTVITKNVPSGELKALHQEIKTKQDEVIEAIEEALTVSPEGLKAIEEMQEPKEEDLIKEYLYLEEKCREAKKAFEVMDILVKKMVATFGVGYHWQDKETKAVFQINDNFSDTNRVATAAFVSRYVVDHTMRKQFGDTKGSLSLKAAAELGYKL